MFQTGFPALNSAINPTMKQSYEHHSTVSAVKVVAGWVWLIGVVGMLLYALISFLRLRHRVRASVLLEKGVYVCDDISDPFILGLIRPRICLPSGMDEQTRAYVLSHECAHLKRFDHIWKPLGFLLLSVYWFNPLLWLAYVLLCRDIELACDEKVVKELDDAGKAAYSEALVTASVSRRSIAACPLAFGETGVKSRVKSVLNYKKPAFWIILVAILACIAVAICFLTMPKKNQPDAAEIVGTWEFYKQIVDTYETDWPIEEMLGARRDVLIFRENGTGTELYIRDDVTRENPFTYTVSGNKVSITRNGRDRVPVEFTYDPESSMLRSPEDAGEGLRWYTLYVREGSISYPTVQLTNEQIAGEWKTDGLPVMEGMPLTLSGDLVFDANGTAVLHLNGDNHTEMTVNGTYDIESSVIRFEPEDDSEALGYYPYFVDTLFDLSIKDFKPDNQNTVLASYDPQTDTIRLVVLHFGVLTFRRATPARSAVVMQWLDYYSTSSELPWEEHKEIAIDAFPNVTFRWTSGSVEAIESGKTRTLFQGMPVWNVYLTDLTGDGNPELCATVSFGSGIVDEHIVVYDYVNRQSYTLWDRFTFDYHLYMADGQFLVGKTPYNGDKQVDYGTLVMHDGVLCCQWHSDGSFTPLNRELHESELYGEWLVEKETDNDGNELYAFGALTPWKEYNFKEDGTVIYNETVPYSSDSELAFGHPAAYPYEVHDNYVYIAGDNTSGAFRWGHYDLETHRLTLSYNTAERTVNQTLKRMGEPETSNETELDETTLCTIWTLVEIEASDGSNGDARALGLEQYLVFRSDGTVRIVERDGQGYAERIAPYTWNGNTVRYDDTVLRYDSEDRELVRIDAVTQNVYFYTPTPNAVLPEATPQPELTYVGTWELYTAASFYQEYSSALLDALDVSYTIILQEDGTGTEIIPDDSESKEISIQYTADGNSLTITLMNPETNAAMISYSAVYDPQNDSLVLEDLFETYRYLRKGANKPAYLREITLDTIVGTWETGGIQVVANADPVLNGTIEFRENQTATWTMNGLGENTGNEEFPFSLDGNLIRISQEGEIEIGSFLVYDSLSDTIQFPIMNIGVLTYTRKQANEQSEAGTPANSAVIDRALIGTWELIRAEDSAPEMVAGIKTINEQIAAGNYIMTYRFTENGDAEVYLKSDGSGTYHYTYTTENGTIVFIDNSNRTVWSYSFDEDLLLLSKGTYTQVFRRVVQ